MPPVLVQCTYSLPRVLRFDCWVTLGSMNLTAFAAALRSFDKTRILCRPGIVPIPVVEIGGISSACAAPFAVLPGRCICRPWYPGQWPLWIAMPPLALIDTRGDQLCLHSRHRPLQLSRARHETQYVYERYHHRPRDLAQSHSDQAQTTHIDTSAHQHYSIDR